MVAEQQLLAIQAQIDTLLQDKLTHEANIHRLQESLEKLEVRIIRERDEGVAGNHEADDCWI